MEMLGPIWSFPYETNMADEIGMIAGGTGINPMYQLIKQILRDPLDNTKISLIYANRNEGEIVLKNELEILSRNRPDRLRVYYVLDEAPKNWEYGKGIISKKILKENLPTGARSLVLVCGPEPMVKYLAGRKVAANNQGALDGLLKELEYTEQNALTINNLAFSNQIIMSEQPKKEKKSEIKLKYVGSDQYSSKVDLEILQSLYLEPSKSMVETDKGSTLTFTPTVAAYPAVKNLKQHEKKRILVTGGAGFVGSHLVDRLMLMGHEVIALDNLFTGNKRNIIHWVGHPNFEFVRHDVVDPFMVEVDQIYHLACPASPPHYQYNPVKTVKTSVMGTINMLGLAKRTKARFLLTSTSEIYGDPIPEQHPQVESYWGNVNPIGPRACYDEGKRVGETLTYAYAKQDNVDVRVARIFNTFGPRMNEFDGRVVSNFIIQALKGEDITVYGDGSQTRSFAYVHDLVDGLISLMNGNYTDPVNLGNPEEFAIQHFAEVIRDTVNKSVDIVNLPATTDDPQRRKPDITRAKQFLGWSPKFTVAQGVEDTVAYFRTRLESL
ncbi:UDP-glucuronic acid decarboxylase 1 [Lobulomyces angularis]|nr:UDP-glucuronic acid decarboxylase 1 [Lobulomyces angularis]